MNTAQTNGRMQPKRERVRSFQRHYPSNTALQQPPIANHHRSPPTTIRPAAIHHRPPAVSHRPPPTTNRPPAVSHRPQPPPATRLFIGRRDDETERYQRTITVLRNTRRRPITSRISALNGDRDPTFEITQSRLIIGTQRTRRISRHRL